MVHDRGGREGEGVNNWGESFFMGGREEKGLKFIKQGCFLF